MKLTKKTLTALLGFTVFITYPAASFAMTEAQEKALLKKAEEAYKRKDVKSLIKHLTAIAESDRPTACKATLMVNEYYHKQGEAVIKVALENNTIRQKELNKTINTMKKWNSRACKCGDELACTVSEHLKKTFK